MTIERRSILKRGAAAAAASVLPGTAFGEFADNSGNFDTEYGKLESFLLDYFAGRGYSEVEQAALVTDDHGFNGGLRYDALGVPDDPGQMVVQGCARIDDIGEKHRPEVLPLFNIFHWAPPSSATADDNFRLLHQALTESIGLDTSRMGFVSIPEFEVLRPSIERMGLSWSQQVVVRDPDEALAAGDGSGYWRRPYPLAELTIPSAGVYYWIGDGRPDHPLTYPTSANWTEIADVGFDGDVDLAASCGLERLVLAATSTYPTWNDRLTQLLERIDRDASSDREPPGKHLFENS